MLKWLIVIILSLAPISELRGAIPTGIAIGLNPTLVFLISVLFNSLIFFPLFFGLKFFYSHIKNNNFFSNVIEHIRKKGRTKMEKYGIWGLLLFVAIPLPLTGAWTASLVAWLFDLKWWKSFVVITIGVLIAGIIVSLSTIGVLSFL